MKFAAEEVATAENKAKAAARAVREFRNRRSVFDPEKQSSLELGQISRMQEELVSTRAQLAESTRLARDNPRVRALRDRVSTLEGEIEDAKNKVAGSSTSLSNKTADYERLALEQEFADKQLATALASLEQARNEAQRKQLYLERIVQASTPDVAVEPKRFRSVFATLIVGLVLWGISAMLIAGIREHQD
jgi:capsular polysaccharide transport system permease protein